MKSVDELIAEYMGQYSRQDKIERILDNVDTWDTDSLACYVKDRIAGDLSSVSDIEVDDEFAIAFDYEIDTYVEEAMNDQNASGLVESNPVCDCSNLFAMGHDSPNCPYNKKT